MATAEQATTAAKQPSIQLSRYAFLTGPAGTGKTYMIRQQLENDPYFGLLTATTGIAAINLSNGTSQQPVTVHSALGFVNEDSVRRGKNRILRNIEAYQKAGYRRLIIDEISMLGAGLLDLVNECCVEANWPVLLTGDFAQLPPVQAGYAFDAMCWNSFYRPGEIRLTTIHRQADPLFLSFLHACRSGDNDTAYNIVQRNLDRFFFTDKIGMAGTTSDEYHGVTLYATNSQVDTHNNQKLERLLRSTQLPSIVTHKKVCGAASAEWVNIPDKQKLCIGAQVMILNNHYADPMPGESQKAMIYANGDVGEITDVDPNRCLVRLYRNNEEVEVGRIIRNFYVSSEEAALWHLQQCNDTSGFKPYQDEKSRRWVAGWCSYLPVRLAWATTVHKSQGLTLDDVQIDISHATFSKAAMLYVALSRCKTLEGLRIVGTPQRVYATANASILVKRAGYL